MRTLRTFACIAGIILLTGCAGFGDVWREHAAAEALLQTQMPPARNYITNPFTPLTVAQPQAAQPSWGTPAGEQYQTIMVNTPQGIVYKRCKVLNGQVVACF